MTEALTTMLAKAIQLHGENLAHAVGTREPVAGPAATWLRDGLESVASAIDRLAEAQAATAQAITQHGEAVSSAIDVHSESIDRLADAVETRAS